MSVNLGMTANAAAAHRHEFSASPKQRSSSSPLPSFPQRFFPFNIMPVKRSETLASDPGATTPSATIASVVNSSFSTPRTSTEDERVFSDSSLTADATLATKDASSAEKRPRRSKTSYGLALPPPTTRHKRLIIRPRLLLQLQQVSGTTRPIPALDVLPSSLFGPRLPGKFSSMFRRDMLGPQDVVVVPSDSYEPLRIPEDDASVSSSDDSGNNREVVATICQPRKPDSKTKGVTEICLDSGSCWKASSLPSGGYEFVSTNEHGIQLCGRWVLRGKAKSQKPSGSGDGAPEDTKKRFIFSIIDPSTRRHPVIAWMSRRGIDVLDHYPQTTVTSQTSSGPSSSNTPKTSDEQEDRSLDPSNEPLKPIDDQTRTLIVVTGLWVALREGWSGKPIHSDTTSSISSPNTPTAPSVASAMTNEAEQGTPIEKETRRSSLHSMGSCVKQAGSTVLHRSATQATNSRMPMKDKSSRKDGQSKRASFIDKSNRRSTSASTSGKRRRRFSMPTQTEMTAQSDAKDSHRNQPGISAKTRTSRSMDTGLRMDILDAGDSTTASPDEIADEDTRRQVNLTQNDAPAIDGKAGKGKKWRRLSSWFDSFGKGSKGR